MRLLVTVLLVATALAGCTEEAIPDGFVECDDGTLIELADYPESNRTDFDAMVHCPPESGVALHIVLNTTTVPAYTTLPVVWYATSAPVLDHTTASGIRIVTDGSTPPADGVEIGEELANVGHTNLPLRQETTWAPEEPGTYMLYAYAEAGGRYYWSAPLSMDISDLVPTGEVHEVTLGQGGPLAALSPSTLNVVVGDAFVIINNDAIAHSFTTTAGPANFTVTVDAGATSDQVVIMRKGSYTYSDDDYSIRGNIEAASPRE